MVGNGDIDVDFGVIIVDGEQYPRIVLEILGFGFEILLWILVVVELMAYDCDVEWINRRNNVVWIVLEKNDIWIEKQEEKIEKFVSCFDCLISVIVVRNEQFHV